MQFTLLTFVTLFAAAIAAPLKGEEDLVVKRQAAGGQPTTSQPAMTAQDGSVVAFDTAGVYLDSVAKGL
ncbi:hypothetical protein INS49_013862 [Diaporthe citri]|uniref:uncharacterized protein n=1 Tax=Diaporthe citri TaxID=83186 RepID=UPI001C8004AE|nr:uncharacterized protein INS49_013862 [Diaporthe citri]KAG6357979.1 hypothetical protein INS49_013862 [Diaporthe citri]